MEKFHSYESKYTPEQIKKFDKIIEENNLEDEDPDNFVIHAGNKVIRIIKKEEIDLIINKKHASKLPIETAIKATVKYPDLPLSEAVKKLDQEK